MLLSRDAAREVDRRAIEELGIPGVVLMENAGRNAAELLLALGVTGRVLICCGRGNNGGDGFVMARHLAIQKIPVRVLLFGAREELRGDAATHFTSIERMGVPLEVLAGEQWCRDTLRRHLQEAAWVVDALFGTGLSGPVRAPLDQVIEAINASSARVLAVDIPSGLDCDTGQPLSATVRADHTVTFVAAKQGFSAPAARPYLGQVHVVDIGAPYMTEELTGPA
ncbi:MAG: NAD(P)H-hydrate epimerase [Gemmataceae bacterium]